MTSSYRIPSVEKIINRVINFIFYYRLLFVLLSVITIAVMIVIFYKKASLEGFRNGALILTCGSIIIGIFYSIINYEHNYDKSQHDRQLSRQILAFNVAFEWHKPTIVEHLKTTKKLYEKYKHLIEGNKPDKFSAILEKNEQARASLIALFNYFETIAGAVQCNVMDKELANKYFCSLFKQFHRDYNFYIEYRRRQQNNERMWSAFTKLAREWAA